MHEGDFHLVNPCTRAGPDQFLRRSRPPPFTRIKRVRSGWQRAVGLTPDPATG